MLLDALPKLESQTDATRRTVSSDPPTQWVNSSHSEEHGIETYNLFLVGSVIFPDEKTLWVETLSHSISALFVARICHIPQVERVLWRREETRVRVWTIIDQSDIKVEDQIYKAQIDLMETLPDYTFDLAVIFRQGKPPDSIRPRGAEEVFARD
jgi:hypothetical protein